MKILKERTRENVVKAYLARESKKPDKKPIGHLLDFNNPDQMNNVLCDNDYKYGVITGFKKWGYAQVYKEDLKRCAIVDSIKEFQGRRQLSELVSTPAFNDWKSDRPVFWNERLNKINVTQYPEDLPIILRPSVPEEYPADWYIEDGSGRSVLFLRRLIRENNNDGFMIGFVGHEPDTASTWMRRFSKRFFCYYL